MFFFNYYLKGTLNAIVFIIFINDVKKKQFEDTKEVIRSRTCGQS
jgi:hypothetical protein